jgi:hypothetical protein
MIPDVIDSNKELLNSTWEIPVSMLKDNMWISNHCHALCYVWVFAKSPFIFGDKVDKVRITENSFGSFY